MIDQGAQLADSPPLEMHRAFVGQTGEFRAGPIVPKLEQIYDQLARPTSLLPQAKWAYRVPLFATPAFYDEALGLFVCAPYSLYSVNNNVDFDPYRTAFD